MLCKSCEEGELFWVDRDDGNGYYMCEKNSNLTDCAIPVNEETYKTMESDAKSELEHNIKASARYTNSRNLVRRLHKF